MLLRLSIGVPHFPGEVGAWGCQRERARTAEEGRVLFRGPSCFPFYRRKSCSEGTLSLLAREGTPQEVGQGGLQTSEAVHSWAPRGKGAHQLVRTQAPLSLSLQYDAENKRKARRPPALEGEARRGRRGHGDGRGRTRASKRASREKREAR